MVGLKMPLWRSFEVVNQASLGIPTVCSVGSKFTNGQVQYYANTGLKLNLKLRGMNKILKDEDLGFVQSTKIMVVGMDVTHPSSLILKGAPSIAAVVASVDSKLGQLPASIRAQEGRKEMITELKDMIVERLME